MRTPPSGDASSEAPEREARVSSVPADLAAATVREARVPSDLAPVREARVARVPADLAPAPVREREAPLSTSRPPAPGKGKGGRQ